MSEVSAFRLYLLRAMYVFMFVGLAIVKWPGIFNPLVPLVMPWSYVFKQYVKAPGDPWGKRVTVSSANQPSYGHPQS